MKTIGVATVINNVNDYERYPPFLEKLSKVFELHIFFFRGSPQKKSTLIYHKVPYKGSLNIINIVKIVKIILPLIKRENIEVLYILDGIFYELLGYMISRKLRIPFILRLRTNEYKVRLLKDNIVKTSVWKVLHDFVLKNTDGISCISHELCHYARSITKTAIIKLIYHGVDVNIFKPFHTKSSTIIINVLKKRPLTNIKDIVLVVSGLQKIKGAEILIKVAKMLPHINFLVIGQAERKYITKNLPPNIHYIGRVTRDTMPLLYNLAKLTFMPSLTEGLPDTILESFACMTPVYASPVGEIPYVVNESVGWLIKRYNAEAVASELKDILSHDEELYIKGKNARDLVKRKFKWEHYVENTKELIETVLRK